MRILSTIILIVFLGILPSCKYFKGEGLFGRKAREAASLLAIRDSLRVADSIKIIQDQLLAIENEKLDSARKADNEQLLSGSKYKFNIIVGSFIMPENAKGYAEVFRKRGYDAKIIRIQGNSFELVSAEGHESFNKAFSRLKEFRDTVEFEAWLYIKE
jgi:hypothetical protein